MPLKAGYRAAVGASPLREEGKGRGGEREEEDPDRARPGLTRDLPPGGDEGPMGPTGVSRFRPPPQEWSVGPSKTEKTPAMDGRDPRTRRTPEFRLPSCGRDGV